MATVAPTPNPGKPGGSKGHAAPGSAWATHAGALAAWFNKNVVNRRDCFGHYIAKEKRTDPDLTAYTDKSELTLKTLERHFRGQSGGDLIGVHSTVRDEPGGPGEVAGCWSRFLAIDADAHSNDVDREQVAGAIGRIARLARQLGFSTLLIDSGGGYHLWIIFDKPVATAKVHAFGKWLIRDWQDVCKTGEAPEVFPKQATIGPGEFGNWIRLPGRHHTRDAYSRVWSEQGECWLEDLPAVKAILATGLNPEDKIPAEAIEWAKPKPSPKPRRKLKVDPLGDAAKAQDALECIKHMADPYDEWVKIGMSLSQLADEGLALWESWSRNSAKYQDGDCERKWKTFKRGGGEGGRGLGTLFYEAGRFGYKQPGEPPPDFSAGVGGRPGTNGTQHGPVVPTGPTAAPTPADFLARWPRTDLGNAERLVARHGGDLRYCHPWQSWLVWNGRRWKTDDTAEARRRARDTTRSILAEAAAEPDDKERGELVKWALASEKRDRLAAMLYLAEAEEGIPILPAEMDTDPWAFNCRNGTIDLRTGRLRPHRRGDLITKLCPLDFDPAAECPLWLATLYKFFARPDATLTAKLVDYWHRLCGYAIAGVIRDHVMPVAHGPGGNGKSTILGGLLDVLGCDYAMKATPDFFMAKKNDPHPTDRADLFGKRLVVAIETEAGRRLNETLIKELTGGDRIRARRMREDFWEFSPTHTLIMATNHKPVVRGTDHGIWRRLRLVPFVVKIPDCDDDKGMPDRLRAEAAGILAWCVRGCLEWQRRGLDAPDEVTKATEDYRAEQDLVGTFLDQCVIRGPNLKVKAGELYKAYKLWAEDGNEFALTLTRFGEAIRERGIESRKSSCCWYFGIDLNPDRDNPEAPDLETGTL